MVCVNAAAAAAAAAAAVADCFMYIMCRRPVSFWSVAAGVEFCRVHFLWCFSSETSLHVLYGTLSANAQLKLQNFNISPSPNILNVCFATKLS